MLMRMVRELWHRIQQEEARAAAPSGAMAV
jgi:hypothetical protein